MVTITSLAYRSSEVGGDTGAITCRDVTVT